MDDEERRGSALKLIFSGVGLFAATWILTIPITAAASDGSITGDATPLSAIPFAGPFLIMDNHELTTEGDVVYGIVGGLQLAAPVIVFFGSLGLMDSDDPQPVQLVANGHGLALGGSF